MALRFLTLGALALCMAPAGEGGGGTGGDNKGDGSGAGGGEPPKYVTVDELNKALGARDKRMLDSFGKQFTSFEEKFGKLVETLQPKAPEGGGAGEGDASKKRDPDQVRRDREFEEMKKTLAEERKARLDAEQRGRTEKARAQLQTALAKHARPEVVSTLLKAMQNDVQFDEQTGEPLFPLGDGTTSTIDAAIESWAKSNDAKPFLPAPNGGGAGTPRGGASGSSTSNYKNKPREQWTPDDVNAAFQDNLKRVAETAI